MGKLHLKVQHDTLCNDFKHSGLKNVGIWKKIIILQCSWIKRLYDGLFHQWRTIPLHLISRTFGKSFIFHSNLSFKKKLIKSLPSFYKQIFLNWKSFFSKTPETSSGVLFHFYGIISIFKLMKAIHISLGFHKMMLIQPLIQTARLKPGTF